MEGKRWPFQVVADGDKPVFKLKPAEEEKGEERTFTPEEVSSTVLGAIK